MSFKMKRLVKRFQADTKRVLVFTEYIPASSHLKNKQKKNTATANGIFLISHLRMVLNGVVSLLR